MCVPCTFAISLPYAPIRTQVRYGMEDYKSRGRDSSSYDMCTSNDIRLQVRK